MARPPKPPRLRKHALLAARVSPGMAVAVAKTARKLRMPISEWLRIAVHNELSGIGVRYHD